eukprot:g23714.t1
MTQQLADDAIKTVAQRYASRGPRLEVPELKAESQACEALLDYMKHAAAVMLERRDELRRYAEEDNQGSSRRVTPIV